MDLRDLQTDKPPARSIRNLIERESFTDSFNRLAGGRSPDLAKILADKLAPMSFAESMAEALRWEDLGDMLCRVFNDRLRALCESASAGFRIRERPDDAYEPNLFATRRPADVTVAITVTITNEGQRTWDLNQNTY